MGKSRLAHEWKAVTAMLRICCRDQRAGALCNECQEFMRYIRLRLERCRFGEDKPACAKCPAHCYQPDRREQIKAIMQLVLEAEAHETVVITVYTF